jgi:hypothetical protein
MKKEKYWIAVVSKNHIMRGVKGGFMQANHGKPGSLKKLHANDWVIFYSPKVTYEGDEKLQAFTAIGQVADENLYQFKMTEDFIPYRRNMNYARCKEVPIVPLIGSLDFIRDKKAWGYRFRFGFLEIDEHDFNLISGKMLASSKSTKQSDAEILQQ